MEEERKRDWEKGTAAPIPDNKYEKFKEELKDYSKKYSDRNFTLFMLARATGYRLGDLVGLTVRQIEDALDEGYFLIQESKQYNQWLSNLNKYPNRPKPAKRDAAIEKPLRDVLEKYIAKKKRKEFAFPSNKGDGSEYINQKSYSAILTEVGKRLNLRHISGHSPRKTYATKIYEKSGHDIETVRIALGHKSIEESKRYLGIKDKMKRDAAKMAAEGI